MDGQLEVSIRASYESKKCQPYGETCLEAGREVSLPLGGAILLAGNQM